LGSSFQIANPLLAQSDIRWRDIGFEIPASIDLRTDKSIE